MHITGDVLNNVHSYQSHGRCVDTWLGLRFVNRIKSPSVYTNDDTYASLEWREIPSVVRELLLVLFVLFVSSLSALSHSPFWNRLVP